MQMDACIGWLVTNNNSAKVNNTAPKAMVIGKKINATNLLNSIYYKRRETAYYAHTHITSSRVHLTGRQWLHSSSDWTFWLQMAHNLIRICFLHDRSCVFTFLYFLNDAVSPIRQRDRIGNCKRNRLDTQAHAEQ